MTKRAIRSVRANDWEWAMIKDYAHLLKTYTDDVEAEAKGQLGYKTTVFGVPDSVRVGFFYAVPNSREKEKYRIEAFYYSEEEAPEDLWEGKFTPEDFWNHWTSKKSPEDVLLDQKKASESEKSVIYGYLKKTEDGWSWTSTKEGYLGPDPEKLASKKSIKAAFAYWLSDLMQMQDPVKAMDIIVKK